jgi:dTDP-D-glucose 4,6-dehydratase
VKNIYNTDDYERYIIFVKDRPFNDKRYFITNYKLKKLGWDTTIDFNTGLKELL